MDKKHDINELMTFDTSVWKYGPCEGKRLGWHWIFKSLFDKCWTQFQASLQTVDWTKKQTAQSLFNAPNWQSMKFGMRIAIGRVLRYFVDNGWLPLVVLNPKATGTKHYGWIGG
ncbi:MAG: hypothetical protein IPN53_05295 [Comamonadaceae bacterium]|nr:hypothetical protein [Comamonadaceae bacterium]